MPTVLVPIADGSEEIETVCIVDTLVRAGAEVTVASVMPDQLQCKMSRGIKIVADVLLTEVTGKTFDCIVVPGGMPGAQTIGECAAFVQMLKAHGAANKIYGAVCAAPCMALLANGMIPEGAAATSHPGFAEKMKASPGPYSEERVVVAGNMVTSRGPGTSIEFALKLIELLFDVDKANSVAGPMLIK